MRQILSLKAHPIDSSRMEDASTGFLQSSFIRSPHACPRWSGRGKAHPEIGIRARYQGKIRSVNPHATVNSTLPVSTGYSAYRLIDRGRPISG